LLLAALIPGVLLFEGTAQRSDELTAQAERQSHAATRLAERERTMDVATRHLEDATRQLAGLEQSLSARQQDYENARRAAATAIAEREEALEQLTATKDKARLQMTRADRAEARLAVQQQAVADAQKRLATADAALAALRSPQMRIITLAAGPKAGKAWGRIVWDQQAATWNLVALDLPPAPAGRTYELWFITDKQQKIAAGTFNVNAKGEGALAVNIPAGIGALAVAAVTDEPAGGVAVPTGSIQLVGQL
nr:anti-sigma factor [Planctomycetota bacterium]